MSEINPRVAAVVIALVALVVLLLGWRVVKANAGPNLDPSAVTQPTKG